MIAYMVKRNERISCKIKTSTENVTLILKKKGMLIIEYKQITNLNLNKGKEKHSAYNIQSMRYISTIASVPLART